MAAQQQRGGEHPDTDLLTAFAERTLSERERRSVVTHLAACGQCREVVAIITPAEGPPVFVPERKTSWLTLPLLRWASIGVAAVVVTAVVMLYRHEPARVMRSDAEAVAPTAEVEAPQPPPPAPPAEEQKFNEAPTPAKREQPAPAVKAPAVRPPPVDTLEKKDQLVAREAAPLQRPRENGMVADRVVPAPLPPAAAGGAAPAAVSPRPSSEPATAAESRVPMTMQSADAVPLKSKQAESARADAQLAAPPSRMRRAEVLNAPAASGMFMAKLAVSACPPGGVAGDCHGAGVERSHEWRVSSDGQLLQKQADGTWTTVNLDPAARFRTVVAVDNDVWAGGDRGVLYHSSDAGLTWTRENVTAEDIVRISNVTCSVSVQTRSGRILTRLAQGAGAWWCSASTGKP